MNEKTAMLQEGDLYVVKQRQLMHVEREGDLPKVPHRVFESVEIENDAANGDFTANAREEIALTISNLSRSLRAASSSLRLISAFSLFCLHSRGGRLRSSAYRPGGGDDGIVAALPQITP